MEALAGQRVLARVAPAGAAANMSAVAAARAPAPAVSARHAAAFAGADKACLRASLRAPKARRGSLLTAASSNGPIVAASATPAKAAAPRGADMKALSYSVLAGVVIWLLPAPVGVTLKAWHLLAHFVATIVGIITSVRAAARRCDAQTRLKTQPDLCARRLAARAANAGAFAALGRAAR